MRIAQSRMSRPKNIVCTIRISASSANKPAIAVWVGRCV